MKKIFLLAVFMTGCLWTFESKAEKPYVIDQSGKKMEGDAIQVDQQGNVRLKKGQAVRTFSRNNYQVAFMPKPRNVEKMEAMLEQQRYDVILENGGAVFDKYKYLGWAGRITYIRVEALLANGRAKQALRLAESAERYVTRGKAQLNMAKTSALLKLDRFEEAEKYLVELKKSATNEIAAFAFNATGKLLAQKGRKKDAVLEYLKTVLVIKPGTAPHEQEIAREQVAQILEEIGDPRYKQFEK
ncbi:MAG: hypothetical protein R6V56_06165 [Lentisphaeria bacterium]